MKIPLSLLFLALCCQIGPRTAADDGELRFQGDGTNRFVRVNGDSDDEWRFQTSSDLLTRPIQRRVAR